MESESEGFGGWSLPADYMSSDSSTSDSDTKSEASTVSIEVDRTAPEQPDENPDAEIDIVKLQGLLDAFVGSRNFEYSSPHEEFKFEILSIGSTKAAPSKSGGHPIPRIPSFCSFLLGCITH